MPTYSSTFGGRAGREKKSNVAKDRKSKPKCPICHKAGHEGPECPKRPAGGIPEGGIEFGSKKGGGLGGGRAHKSSKKVEGKKKAAADGPKLELPSGFYRRDTAPLDEGAPFLFVDAGCDVAAVLEHVVLSSKKKSSEDEHAERVGADEAWNFGGGIVRQSVNFKKGWEEDGDKNTRMCTALGGSSTWFSVGIGPGFLVTTADAAFDYEEEEEKIAELLGMCVASESVVSLFTTLDYTMEGRGLDRASQLRRFRATFEAGSDNKVPVCVRVGGYPNGESAAAYKLAVADLLAAIKSTDVLELPPPAVHLTAWAGACDDMIALLNANAACVVYVGFTAAVGYEKAGTELKDCAFDCPLDRVLLETDGPNAVPKEVAEAYGKTAFGHSAYVPFVGDAVAKMRGKEGVEGASVVRAAGENLGRMLGWAEGEMGRRGLARLEEMKAERVEEEGEEEGGGGGEGEGVGEGEVLPPPPPPPSPTKKKKKTKGGKKGKQEDTEEITETAQLEEELDSLFFA